MDSLLPELIAFGQVVFIDLVLAGDNAIVVGMAAAGVARAKRTRVIVWGIGAAVLLRIVFALLATQLLHIIGLTLAGGLLLLWVCWKLFRELRGYREEAAAVAVMAEVQASAATFIPGATSGATRGGGKSVRTAVWEVIIADVSMSLDNVLAVAGAAREHVWVLVSGLLLSVALTGAAANVIVRLLNRFQGIAYLGLLVIAYVAFAMIYRGSVELLASTHMIPRP